MTCYQTVTSSLTCDCTNHKRRSTSLLWELQSLSHKNPKAFCMSFKKNCEKSHDFILEFSSFGICIVDFNSPHFKHDPKCSSSSLILYQTQNQRIAVKIWLFFNKNRKRRRINKWIVCLCFIEKRRNKTSRFPPVKTYSFSHPMRPHCKESYCIIFEFSQLKFDGLVNRLENCTFWCGHTKSLLLLMHQKWTIWCWIFWTV